MSQLAATACDKQNRFQQTKADYEKSKKLFEHAKTLCDPTFIDNTEGD